MNHFDYRDKKEAPAAGRGLESREETPKEGKITDRTFQPLAKLHSWEIGRYLGIMECSSKSAIVSAQSRGDDMNRYGLVLAAILAASPVSAANVTTRANVTGWGNLADCHKCAERYDVRARNLSECQAEWPEGAHTPVTSPYATPAQIAAAEDCVLHITRRRMNRP